MSTLTVTNIKASGETASRSVSGVAAAWCCWNGVTPPAIRDSFGITSLTDNADGDFTFAYTSNFGSANYTISGSFAFSSAITNYVYSVQPRENSAVAASSARLVLAYANSSAQGITDYPYAAFQAHGDLA